jgi:hypothetical protein
MPGAEKGTEYVCGVCGTRLLVTECGDGILEELICCEAPMEQRVAKRKAKARPKKKAKKSAKKKTTRRR